MRAAAIVSAPQLSRTSIHFIQAIGVTITSSAWSRLLEKFCQTTTGSARNLLRQYPESTAATAKRFAPLVAGRHARATGQQAADVIVITHELLSRERIWHTTTNESHGDTINDARK